jgi:hypothetical protein
VVEIFFIFAFCLALLACVKAKQKSALYWSDITAPILLPIFWFLVTSTGYGQQSLSHLIEVPIVVLFSILFLNMRVFVIDRYCKNYKVNSYTVFGLGFVFVLLLRTFMPYLPE